MESIGTAMSMAGGMSMRYGSGERWIRQDQIEDLKEQGRTVEPIVYRVGNQIVGSAEAAQVLMSQATGKNLMTMVLARVK